MISTSHGVTPRHSTRAYWALLRMSNLPTASSFVGKIRSWSSRYRPRHAPLSGPDGSRSLETGSAGAPGSAWGICQPTVRRVGSGAQRPSRPECETAALRGGSLPRPMREHRTATGSKVAARVADTSRRETAESSARSTSRQAVSARPVGPLPHGPISPSRIAWTCTASGHPAILWACATSCHPTKPKSRPSTSRPCVAGALGWRPGTPRRAGPAK